MQKKILIGLPIIFIALFILLSLSYFNSHNGIDMWISIDILSTLLPLFIAVIVAFKFFADYLDNSKNSEKVHTIYTKELKELKKELEDLKNQNLTEATSLTSNEKQELLERLNEQFENNITQTYLDNLKSSLRTKYIEDVTKRSFYRIEEQIENLKRRGTINLFLGMLLSIVGLYFLSSITKTTGYQSFQDLLINITPRTLLVIFIEIFSFFFLNLYKKSLDEVKYFQNELTNLEAKYLALNIAKHNGNFKLLSTTLDHLLTTERNFILKKDETTIELEKSKIETNSSNNTIQALKDIINFKR